MAIDTDDLEPRKPVAALPDLEKMSVDELNDYIADMEREIARVRAVIESKQAHRNSAEGIFKS